jgi:hypothetical protein
MITEKEILFAGLMGMDKVAMMQRLSIVEDESMKHVFLKIPFIPFINKTFIEKGSNFNDFLGFDQVDSKLPEAQQFFPLSFSFTESGVKWLFPYEPMINIASGNNIVKRNVAKQGDKLIGTIKERWSRKDFDITVTGVLFGSMMNGTADDCYPKDDLIKLFDFLKFNKEFYVYCHPLDILGVKKVVVEDYSFPFSKGENVQAYELKLTSDDSYKLLLEV